MRFVIAEDSKDFNNLKLNGGLAKEKEEKSQYCGEMGRISSYFQAWNLRRRPLNEDLGLKLILYIA
jgi:hypothetical protein